MQILFLLNDAPYGSDKTYNALRAAIQLQKQNKAIKVVVYLMSDAVVCAVDGQNVKQGNYNIGSMLSEIVDASGEVKICTSCAESRGLKAPIKGAFLGTLSDLTNWIVSSDKVLTF